MALGLPCVSTRVGGIPEIVTDGETGFLIEPDNPLLLAEALAKIAAKPDRARSMGASGRRRTEGRFDRRVNVSRLHAVAEA